MRITGQQFIGRMRSAEGSHTFTGINPKTGKPVNGNFYEATSKEINRCALLAEEAFQSFRNSKSELRASLLEKVAKEIMNLGDELILRAMEETALPKGRLQGERGRTVNQLKLFAEVLREGSWVDARIDTAIKDRIPNPREDIRYMLLPLGPVGIFGASNFPLAFSVAGGDTASALAAGCPVVVKAHPAHPGTSELVATAIARAVESTGLPEGVFSMVQGISHDVGTAIVQHPCIKAVGFTGSFKGGKALFDLANQRETPIPVFAEMGSTNPIFILPEVLKKSPDILAKGLVNSVTLGVGQFCTNPGLVFINEGSDKDTLISEISNSLKDLEVGSMLTQSIQTAYQKQTEQIESEGTKLVAIGKKESSFNAISPKIFATSVQRFLNNESLQEEIFGPSTILIASRDRKEMMTAASNLTGHLTATIHGTPKDLSENRDLIGVLEQKVGRLIINGFPTGVEVCHAMVHGGPFPATTASSTTSVGTQAIKRFVRPVCYQNFPDELLPNELKNENPKGIMRLINGKYSTESIIQIE